MTPARVEMVTTPSARQAIITTCPPALAGVTVGDWPITYAMAQTNAEPKVGRVLCGPRSNP